jgi:hypothetical protein
MARPDEGNYERTGQQCHQNESDNEDGLPPGTRCHRWVRIEFSFLVIDLAIFCIKERKGEKSLSLSQRTNFIFKKFRGK